MLMGIKLTSNWWASKQFDLIWPSPSKGHCKANRLPTFQSSQDACFSVVLEAMYGCIFVHRASVHLRCLNHLVSKKWMMMGLPGWYCSRILESNYLCRWSLRNGLMQTNRRSVGSKMMLSFTVGHMPQPGSALKWEMLGMWRPIPCLIILILIIIRPLIAASFLTATSEN